METTKKRSFWNKFGLHKKGGENDTACAEEADVLLLPQNTDYLDMEKQYSQIMFFYESGIRQLTAKLEISNHEFQNCYDRNPIENIKSRVKSPESILKKMDIEVYIYWFWSMCSFRIRNEKFQWKSS